MQTAQRPRYADLLNKWIEESGLTLRQIAARCAELGQPITHSYISKVRLGSSPAPSWDVSVALATALGKRHEPLGLLLTIEQLPEGPWRDFFWAALSLGLVDDRLSPLEQLESMTLTIYDLPFVLTAMINDVKMRAGDEPPYAFRLGTGETITPTFGEPYDPCARLLMFDQVPDGPIEKRSWRDAANVGRIAVDFEIARDAVYALSLLEDIPEIGAKADDKLMIRPGAEGVESGDTILVRKAGKVTARRYYHVRGGYRLEPELPGEGEPEILGIVNGMVRHM